MSPKPTVLIVDDDAHLRKTLTDILRVKGYTPAPVTTGRGALDSVQAQTPAVALIDLRLEDMSGLEVMSRIRRLSPRTECIVLTGHASQASAIEAIHLGAYGYLQKPYDVEQLLLTIRHALERQEAQKHSQRLLEQQLIVNRLALALGEAHDLQRVFYTVYDHVRDLMDAEAFIVSFYDSQARLFRAGYVVSSGQVLDVSGFPPIPLEEPGRGTQSRVIHSGQPCYVADYRRAADQVQSEHTITPDQQVVAGPPPDDEVERTRSLICVPMKVEGRIIGVMQAQSYQLDAYTPADVELLSALANVAAIAVQNARLFQDLQDQIHTQRETQMKLIQAEKMAALGQLAGGIAHDFNNLLTVIHISSRLLEKELRPQDPLWIHVQRIQDAGQRAVALTRQLLSFSRKEVVEPRLLDLNEIIHDLSKMLRRIIGEDVELEMALADDLWPVRADPSQVDQVLMNVVVNARDAMPGGGRLTLETANVTLDKRHADRHLDARPGEHALLAITDTGLGMDEATQARIFEPFFTTKEQGKGTGLGLATVYGIVTQGGGHIVVDSRPGQGATFRLYWPRAEVQDRGQAEAEDAAVAPAPPSASPATILVVEDSDDVRELTVSILREEEYRVLAAGDGAEALRLAGDHEGPINLLLTDVVMPHLSGKELADQIKGRRPEIKVLYASGYTDDKIAHHGVLEAGVAFLRKPFTLENLTDKVRSVLDSGA